MDFFTSIQDVVQKQAAQLQGNVNDYLKNQVLKNQILAPLVKKGAPPTGNLTVAQVAAGQRGSTPPLAPPQAAPETIARAEGTGMSAGMLAGVSLPLILGLGLGAFFLFKRK